MCVSVLSFLQIASARRRFSGLLLCWCLLAVPCRAPAAEVSADKEHLVKMVVLTRHGVRTPTQSRDRLEQWSARPWPEWPRWTPPGMKDIRPDAPGRLTERGARLVSALWEYERARLDASGLFTPVKCPEQKEIFVYADLDQRTRATAQALLEGLAPTCGLRYATAASGVHVDPLFHPVRAGTTELDATAAARCIQQEQGADLSVLAQALHAPLSILADIAGPLPPTSCRRATLAPGATLADLPTRLKATDNDSSLHVEGALGIGSAMTEVFLLEYAEWPDRPAGWGRVSADVLQKLLPLHARVFNVINRNPEVARAGGSPLLTAMVAALNGDHPDPRFNAAKLTVFVGHDTNIAQVAALLGLDWTLPGYAPQQTPPGGALILSLWRRGKREYVRAHFQAQSLETLHMEDLSRQKVLDARLPVPGCPASSETGLCERQHFLELARTILAPTAREAAAAAGQR